MLCGFKVIWRYWFFSIVLLFLVKWVVILFEIFVFVVYVCNMCGDRVFVLGSLMRILLFVFWEGKGVFFFDIEEVCVGKVM